MWAIVGIVLCMLVLAVAVWKSKHGGGSYYERQIYGMSARTHRVYGGLSAVFALLFASALLSARLPVIPLLAAYALLFILYFSSFVRGFSDEE